MDQWEVDLRDCGAKCGGVDEPLSGGLPSDWGGGGWTTLFFHDGNELSVEDYNSSRVGVGCPHHFSRWDIF